MHLPGPTCVAVALQPRTTSGLALAPASLPTPATGLHPAAARSSGGCRWARCAPRVATCHGALAAGACMTGYSPACRPLACCSEHLLGDHPFLGCCMGGLMKLLASPPATLSLIPLRRFEDVVALVHFLSTTYTDVAADVATAPEDVVEPQPLGVDTFSADVVRGMASC